MNAFEYANPTSVDDAVSLLSDSWGETEVLAGGTDLVTLLKQGLTAPRLVVSLSNVKQLSGISKKGGSLEIGATTTLSELVANADVQEHFPALVTAANNIGSTQILNAGTVGGDLLQRPRCWYFRNGFGLFGTHDGEPLVPTGDNRYHAIFGNSGAAKFVNASSLAPGLIALGATLSVQGPGGAREVKASEFYSTPKSENDREYTLKPNEVLTGVSIPMQGLRNGTYEVRQRQGLDWPMVAASVAFEHGGGTVSDARIVLGHVAPVPWFAEKASKELGGKQPNDAALKSASEAAVADATPLSRNGYKVQQLRVAVRRAIEAALA
ncbi:MAG: xanthine dehydrogenase family protein subunit M [Candidatus Hydrogenedentes bacterium]|nr:xanthine dehydrogenase family protein subunit M [Candidatus Hydrogenedentota bacterium]